MPHLLGPRTHATGLQARTVQSRYYLCVDATPNHWVRTFVWAATWNPDTRKVDIVFDEIGLENAIAENPELLKPLPDKVLRKAQGRKGSRSKGSTRK